MWEELVRALGGGYFIQLGPTDAALPHFYQYLPSLQLIWSLHNVNNKWLPALLKDCRLKFSGAHRTVLFEVDKLVVSGET